MAVCLPAIDEQAHDATDHVRAPALRRMRIRLTKKLAERLDGIDVSFRRVGDVLDLPLHDAVLLVAEGWARPVADTDLSARTNPDTESESVASRQERAARRRN